MSGPVQVLSMSGEKGVREGARACNMGAQNGRLSGSSGSISPPTDSGTSGERARLPAPPITPMSNRFCGDRGEHGVSCGEGLRRVRRRADGRVCRLLFPGNSCDYC